MNTLARPLIAVAVLAPLAGFLLACTEAEEELSTATPTPSAPRPPAVTAIPLSPQPGPEQPTLTAEQQQKVRDIIASDPLISQIVAGRSHSIGDIGPWTTGVIPETGAYQLIGATAKITLAEPIPHVELDWPYEVGRPYYYFWPPELRARFPLPYREGTQRFAVENLSEMYVLVDLGREKLVEITVMPLPGGGQTVTHPPAPTPEPVAGGEELAQRIFAVDQGVQALLSGRDYRIYSVAASVVGSKRLGSIIVQWDDREDIEADWPILIDLDEETGAYEVATIRFKAETVGRLDVLIDLDKQQVIAIEPSVGD